MSLKMMKKYSFILCFHVLAITSCGCYQFQIQFVKNFKGMRQLSWLPWQPTDPDQKFSQLEAKEFDDMCTKAQEYAQLDGLNSGARSYLPFYDFYQFVNVHYKRLPHIECRTIPTSYLRLEKLNAPIGIVMQTNKFIDDTYTFQINTVRLEPVSCTESIRKNNGRLAEHSADEIVNTIRSVCNKQLKGSDLYQVSSTDRLHICLAAREAIRRSKRFDHPIVFEQGEVGKPEMFGIEYAYGKQRQAALRCPCSPSMYVHLGIYQLKTHVLQVLIVTDEVLKELKE